MRHFLRLIQTHRDHDRMDEKLKQADAEPRCAIYVIDLHGRLDQVHCTDCYGALTREEMQQDLARLNPHLVSDAGEIAPDGDADVPDGLVARMTVPDCAKCGGTLKPSVVFYGGGGDKKVVTKIFFIRKFIMVYQQGN